MSLCIYTNELLWISEQFVELKENAVREGTGLTSSPSPSSKQWRKENESQGRYHVIFKWWISMCKGLGSQGRITEQFFVAEPQ